MSWFEGKRDFPLLLKLEEGKPIVVTFKEKTVRKVGGKYRREIVIEVEVAPIKNRRSLFLSHVDLQRLISKLEDKHKSLLDVTAKITLVEKVRRVGNPWYKYEVVDMTNGQYIR